MWYFLFGVVVAWILFNTIAKNKAAGGSDLAHGAEHTIDEEEIQERQQEFEEFMVHSSVPTALGSDGKAYYFQMKNWFSRLDERYSHNEDKQQKIRRDWLSYMYHIDHGASAKFLWLESDDEKSGRHHEDEARDSALRSMEIEDRFASLMGEEAKTLLKKMRGKDAMEWLSEDVAQDEQKLD